MSDYILIANGNFLVKEIIEEAIQDKIIVALDGATHKLLALNIKPKVVLGDFDSIHADNTSDIATFFKQLTEQHHITVVPAKNQNLTDLVKGIHYCDSQHAKSITIICALDERLDHHEATLRSLRSEYRSSRTILLHSEQQTIRFVKDETISISGEIGDKCGMLAFPKATISSHGLEYEVEDFDLSFGFSESIGNALRETNATVTVSGEALLILPPQLAAQREFMKKTLVERLKIQLRDAIIY